MESELFNDLVQSLKEAQGIIKGEIQPSRLFIINNNELDVNNSIQELKEALHKVGIKPE